MQKQVTKIQILYNIFIFYYSTEGPYGIISFERPYKVIVAQVNDVATWAPCLSVNQRYITFDYMI